MARIHFSNILSAAGQPIRPLQNSSLPLSYAVGKTHRLSDDAKDLVQLKNPRNYRSMNRTAILLCAASFPVAPRFFHNGEKMGLYCAVDNGADNIECAQKTPGEMSPEFADEYRRNKSPRDYLKQLPNLAPAQLAIELGFTQELHVFNHSKWAGYQAIEQAEIDLDSGAIDLAIVVGAHALEDPLMAFQRSRTISSVLTEGAFAMGLRRGGESISARLLESGTASNHYGPIDSVMSFLLNRNIEPSIAVTP